MHTLHRLYALIVKELLQFSRDRLLLLVILIGPAMQLWVVGGSSDSSASGIPAAVIDLDRSELSRQAITAIDNTPELAVRYYPATMVEGSALIDRGAAGLLVIIPPGFAANLRQGVQAQVQMIVDGSNVSAAGDVQGAAQGAIETMGWNIALAAQVAGRPARGADLRQEALYNSALDDRLNEVTAHLAFFTFLTVSLIAVMGIVRELELGTIEQLLITPLGQVELIVGKAVGPALIGLLNFGGMFLMARLMFGLPMRGSLPLLAAMAILYLSSEVCIALLISTVTRTQAQAITVVFIWIMVALTMSGFLVPISSLPGVLHYAAYALPLQHFIEIVRGVMLRGAGLAALWPNVAALVALDAVVITVTALLLKRIGD